MSARPTRVYVNKAADLPLNGGSLNEAVGEIRQAAEKHVSKLLKLKKPFDVFISDIFSDSVVADIMQFKPKGGPPKRMLLSIPFTSNAGVFEFGKPIPVKRQISYVPVAKREKSFWE